MPDWERYSHDAVHGDTDCFLQRDFHLFRTNRDTQKIARQMFPLPFLVFFLIMNQWILLFIFLPSGFNIISSGGVLTIFSEGLRALRPYVVGSHLVTDKKVQALRNVLTCSVWARLPKTWSPLRFLSSTMQSPVISYLFFFFFLFTVLHLTNH